MYTTVSTASTTTYTDPSRRILSPIALAPRPTATKDSFGWFYPDDSDSEQSFQNWSKPATSTTDHLNSSAEKLYSSLQKKFISSNMPSRTVDNADRTPPGVNGARRWRVNSSGQVIDAEAESASWELADEIGRLRLGDVTADTGDPRVPMRTPPKSKVATATVITETSPLDSSSNTSVGSSPHVPVQDISHSRGSSADTSSRDSLAGNALLAHPSIKPTPSETKERPRSFSGGLSSADLRRLQEVGDANHDRQLQQQQQWTQNQYRDQNNEQLSYPSLTNQIHRPMPQAFNYPPSAQELNDRDREDGQNDYNTSQQQQRQRNFAPAPPHLNHGLVMNPMNTSASQPPQFAQPRPTNAVPSMNYRQTARNFAPQGPNAPPTLSYTGGHTSHLSLGNTQQLYEMMLPGPPPPVHENHHPAVARVQQQHNVFRGTHHHSASDPSALRDVAALQLLNNNMQNFNPNLFQPGIPPQPMQLYPNQYYAAPTDLAVQQVMAARLQAQYTGSYGVATPSLPREEIASPTSSSGQVGPSANNRKLGLYKTELCRSWEEKGTCRYSAKCQFAHGEDELRKVQRHPKYKTEICKTFWVSGSCPYGKRCCFIHTELSPNTPGNNNASENTPPQPSSDAGDRPGSEVETSSSISLLSRIRSQPTQESPTTATPSTPVEINNPTTITRPNALRVDTKLDNNTSSSMHKSAYPAFNTRNPILLPTGDSGTVKSPAPVTAGPDFGRHFGRMEIVGYPNHQKKNSTSSVTSNPLHTFDGSDADLNFISPSPSSYGQDGTAQTPTTTGPSRVNGHVRSGSAGNWGSLSRSSLSTSTSAYPHGTSAAGEIMSNSPWSSTELSMGSSRLHEKTWA